MRTLATSGNTKLPIIGSRLRLGIFLTIGLLAFDAGNGSRWSQAAAQPNLDGTRPLETETIPPRGDPDAIYQGGNTAAKVTGPRIALDQSMIYFAQVSDAASLDITKPFLYRGYMLNFVSADGNAGTPDKVYQNMVCKVRGRTR